MFVLVCFVSCKQQNSQSLEAASILTEQQQSDFLWQISRYIGELPKTGGYDSRGDSRFDEHYRNQAKEHKLKYFFEDEKTGSVYFLVTRIAPSIHEKYVALGGKLRKDSEDNIIAYEELFRTWKFPMKELEPKADKLFKEMVEGQDLSKYYPEKAGDSYIEFPNALSRYDTELRRWVSIDNPLDSLYQLREKPSFP